MFGLTFKKTITTAILATSVMLAGCSDDKSPQTQATDETTSSVVKVGMSGTYYPFTFMEQGELKGFEVDLWNEIGNRLNSDVEFVTAPFSGLFGMLEAGQLNTISNQITLTQARAERYAFSEPYVYDGAQIAVHQDNNEIHSVDDLAGKKVAVNLGSNFEAILRQNDPEKQINVVTYDTGIEQDVVLKRSDAFVMDRVSVMALIEKSELPLKLAGEPIEILKNAMPFINDEQGKALRDQVNAALDAMREDGTLASISGKWFGGDITAKPAG
ncbi:amino acid ABC transporter substrate-binding protein [Endozoicomonas arenosclerae]|uniref:amino acid ABC transporter substrate-binding protein n=1 Tax=Endozoicomonas arenosclerae TaxID=1633495 RepID=UPI000A77E1FF|nr:amino acid ABC transporter substrate-binding protein [Endozoicomonas arenosclerae]